MLTNGSSFQITNPATDHTFLAIVFYAADTSTTGLTGGNDEIVPVVPDPEPTTVLGLAVGTVGPVAAVRRRKGGRSNTSS